jgi:hypothetical protein
MFIASAANITASGRSYANQYNPTVGPTADVSLSTLNGSIAVGSAAAYAARGAADDPSILFAKAKQVRRRVTRATRESGRMRAGDDMDGCRRHGAHTSHHARVWLPIGIC